MRFLRCRIAAFGRPPTPPATATGGADDCRDDGDVNVGHVRAAMLALVGQAVLWPYTCM